MDGTGLRFETQDHGGEFMAANRINPGFSTSGTSSGKPGGGNVLRTSDTWNLALSATAAVINAGLNCGDTTTNVDFFDVNGDRLPDSVEIRSFPDEVYRTSPSLREYRYIERDNRTYVVEPRERTIIEEID